MNIKSFENLLDKKKTLMLYAMQATSKTDSLVSSIMRYHVVASQLVAPDVALFFLTEKESPSAETKAVFFSCLL